MRNVCVLEKKIFAVTDVTYPYCLSPSFLSIISTGGTGEKDRAPISHESFLLMANSQADMDDWVKAIRRVIWAPFGGGKSKLKKN